MSSKELTEEEKRAILEETVEEVKDRLLNLPPHIVEILNQFTELSRDEVFIENLRKEIIKKYGE